MELKAVIVDDEPLAREGLRQLLASEEDIRIAGEAGDGVEAIELIRRVQPDLIFLDIQMPAMDGFGVVAAITEHALQTKPPVVVFITAYDTFAIEAFAVHAVDYLLKPVDPERFHDAMVHIRNRFDQKAGSSVDSPDSKKLLALVNELATRNEYPKRIMIRDSGRVYFLTTAEISHIEAAGDYVCLHVQSEKHFQHETLQQLQTKLNPRDFIRIHRSTIVNVRFIKELQPMFRGDYTVILTDGKKVTMSRRYREQVMSVLEKA